MYPYRLTQNKSGVHPSTDIQSPVLPTACRGLTEFVGIPECMSVLQSADIFRDIIKEEIARGKYIIMSSHQMATIEEFCEDIVILTKGQAVLQGNLNEIKKSYGRVNLMVKCEGDLDSLIEKLGLNLVNKTPNEYQIKVKKEEEANQLLEEIMKAKMPLIKFELREPSLHEIFVEKVGHDAK